MTASSPTRGRGLGPTGAALLVGLLLVGVVVFASASPYFLTAGNLADLGNTAAVTSMVAAPAVFLIVAGQMDLSVGATAGFCGVVLASLTPDLGLAGALAVTAATGLTVGLLNGSLVTLLGIHSFAVTIGSLALLRGLASLLPSGLPVIMPGFTTLGTARPLGIPLPILLAAAVWLVALLVLRRTPCGRDSARIGALPPQHRFGSGRAKLLVLTAFAVSGLGAALAGTILTSQFGTGIPNAGNGLELVVLAAVLLGGGALDGGRGSMIGALLAVLIVSVLDNGLSLLNVSPYWTQVASGALVLLALVADRWRTHRRRRSAAAASSAPSAASVRPARRAGTAHLPVRSREPQ